MYLCLGAMPACNAADLNYLAVNQEQGMALQPLTRNEIELLEPDQKALEPDLNPFTDIKFFQNDSNASKYETSELLEMTNDPDNFTHFDFDHDEFDVSALLRCPSDLQHTTAHESAVLETPYARKKFKKTLKTLSSFSQNRASSSTDPHNRQSVQENPVKSIHPILEKSEIWKFQDNYYYICGCGQDRRTSTKKTYETHVNNFHRNDIAKIEAAKRELRDCELCDNRLSFDSFTIHKNYCPKTSLRHK